MLNDPFITSCKPNSDRLDRQRQSSKGDGRIKKRKSSYIAACELRKVKKAAGRRERSRNLSGV